MFVIFYLENLVDNSESTAWIYLRMSGSGKNLQTCFNFSNKCTRIYRRNQSFDEEMNEHVTAIISKITQLRIYWIYLIDF